MELETIRGFSDEQLKSEEVSVTERLFRVRFAKSLGRQEAAGSISSLKLQVARMKTIARERQLAATKAGK